MDLVKGQNYLLAMEFRDKAIQEWKKDNSINEAEIQKIMSFDPFFGEKYVLALNFRNKTIKELQQTKDISKKEIELIMSMEAFDAEAYIKNMAEYKQMKEGLIPTTQKTLKELSTKVAWTEIPADWEQEYKIKSWDTLRNIVKRHYWLTSHKQISRFINKIVKHNTNKNNNKYLNIDNKPKGWDFIKWDVLKVGKAIYLPQKEYLDN